MNLKELIKEYEDALATVSPMANGGQTQFLLKKFVHDLKKVDGANEAELPECPKKDGEIYFYLKDDEYGWMSNFYPCEIRVIRRVKLDGLGPTIEIPVIYPNVEQMYQACKSSDELVSAWIAEAPKPYLAMVVARQLREKDGYDAKKWEEIKLPVMKGAIKKKFEQNPALLEMLLETGDMPIHEDSPTDIFWGVKGQDQLGKILMEVRGELRNATTD